MKNPIDFIEDLPQDKKNHLLVGTCSFLGAVIVLSLIFPVFPQSWLFRVSYIGLVIAAGCWEIGQKITGKGKAELADFLYSIVVATVIMIISEIINW